MRLGSSGCQVAVDTAFSWFGEVAEWLKAAVC
jgi:hypothetical protein